MTRYLLHSGGQRQLDLPWRTLRVIRDSCTGTQRRPSWVSVLEGITDVELRCNVPSACSSKIRLEAFFSSFLRSPLCARQ